MTRSRQRKSNSGHGNKTLDVPDRASSDVKEVRIAESKPTLPVDLIMREERNMIRLEGAVDISSAAELKQRLLRALEEAAGSIEVSLAEVTEMDVTAVQLLWAAGRKAEKLGVKFTLADQPNEQIRASLTEVGLDLAAIFTETAGGASCQL
jgi:anti-anti-sigma factor